MCRCESVLMDTQLLFTAHLVKVPLYRFTKKGLPLIYLFSSYLSTRKRQKSSTQKSFYGVKLLIKLLDVHEQGFYYIVGCSKH